MTNTQLAQHEGKLEISAELGELCQDRAKAAEQEAMQRKGGAEALSATGKQIGKQLANLLNEEWEAGDFKDCVSPEAASAKVKRYISRAVGFCENLSAMAKNAELVASGKALALQQVANVAGKYNDASAARIRQLKAPPEPVDPDNPKLDGKGNPRRAPGTRPHSRLSKKTSKKSSKKKAGKKKSSRKRE